MTSRAWLPHNFGWGGGKRAVSLPAEKRLEGGEAAVGGGADGAVEFAGGSDRGRALREAGDGKAVRVSEPQMPLPVGLKEKK